MYKLRYCQEYCWSLKKMIKLGFGSSMLPYLPKMCILGVFKNDKYSVNDVIWLDTLDGAQHCHRIVKIDDFTVTTKGDNLPKSEDYETDVPISKIRGKIKWHFP